MAFIFIALLTGGSAGWLKDALGVRECHQGQCDAEPVAVLMIYINDDNDHSNYTAYNENYEDLTLFVTSLSFSIVSFPLYVLKMKLVNFPIACIAFSLFFYKKNLSIGPRYA